MAQLERSAFIELLNRLGARSDEEALAAARELHETVTANGVKWDDLLIPDSRTTAARVDPEEAEASVDEDGALDEGAAPGEEEEDAVESAGEDDRSPDDDGEEEEQQEEEEQEEEEEDDDDDNDYEEEEEEEEEKEAVEETAAAASQPAEPLAPDPQEAARIVDRLLARKSLSKEMREELAGFQCDIAAGRLADMDSRYIVALAKRFGA